MSNESKTPKRDELHKSMGGMSDIQRLGLWYQNYGQIETDLTDSNAAYEILFKEHGKVKEELAAANAKLEDVLREEAELKPHYEALQRQNDALRAKLAEVEKERDYHKNAFLSDWNENDALLTRAEVPEHEDDVVMPVSQRIECLISNRDSLRQQLRDVTAERDAALQRATERDESMSDSLIEQEKEIADFRTQLTAAEALVKQQAATIEEMKTAAERREQVINNGGQVISLLMNKHSHQGLGAYCKTCNCTHPDYTVEWDGEHWIRSAQQQLSQKGDKQ